MTHACRAALAVLAVAALAMTAVAQTPPAPAPGTPAPPARAPRELPLTVATIAGRVEVRNAAGSWEVAKLRDEVAPGQAARTVSGARATLRTRGGHALRVGQLSQLTVPEKQPEGADAPIRARLDGGYLWVAVGPGSVSAPAFEIDTGAAVLSAFSGATSLLLGGDGSLLVRAHLGRILCKGTSGGAAWERPLKAGEELLVPAGAAPPLPRPLVPDRTDDTWARWNREQDKAGGYGGPAPAAR